MRHYKAAASVSVCIPFLQLENKPIDLKKRKRLSLPDLKIISDLPRGDPPSSCDSGCTLPICPSTCATTPHSRLSHNYSFNFQHNWDVLCRLPEYADLNGFQREDIGRYDISLAEFDDLLRSTYCANTTK